MTGELRSKLLEFRQIDPNTGCWLWTRATSPKGYGVIAIDGKTFRVHRIAYELFIGPITKHILHKLNCPNKNCFNPEHLYEGDNADNQWDTKILGHKSNQNINKTHCNYGHEFTEENTYITPKGKRQCRKCQQRRCSY